MERIHQRTRFATVVSCRYQPNRPCFGLDVRHLRLYRLSSTFPLGLNFPARHNMIPPAPLPTVVVRTWAPIGRSNRAFISNLTREIGLHDRPFRTAGLKSSPKLCSLGLALFHDIIRYIRTSTILSQQKKSLQGTPDHHQRASNPFQQSPIRLLLSIFDFTPPK